MLPSEPRVQTRAAVPGGARKHNKNYLLLGHPLLLVCLLLACHAVSESLQDEVQSTTNQNININNHEETVKSGNTKTNNYNLQESNYQPTQSTQVVFNVGKYRNTNKLRRSRPPTIDEFEIKHRIMDLYSYAREDFQAGEPQSIYFEHLGRVLKALNPKYISTKRVAYVAFADPRDPDSEQVAPEDELPPPTEELESDEEHGVSTHAIVQEPLALRGDSELSLQEQLDLLSDRVKQVAVWDRGFVRKLFGVPDGDFTQNQLAYKRFLQCMTYPLFCKQQMVVKKPNKKGDVESVVPAVSANGELDDLAVAASEPEPAVMIYSHRGGEAHVHRDEQPSEEVHEPQPQPQHQHQQHPQQQQHQQQQQQPQQQQQQVPAQQWRYQQQPPPAPPAPPMAQQAQQQPRYQPRWQRQPTRRFKDQQQVNYKVANPDVNLPQKLIQQYAPQYEEQMARMNRIRRGGHHRHH